jgi:hypothetical protein
MNFDDAIATLTRKFTSGNNISIKRVTITREEWEALKKELFSAKELKAPKERPPVEGTTGVKRIYGWIKGNNLRIRGFYDDAKGAEGENWYTDENGRGWSQWDVDFVPDPE